MDLPLVDAHLHLWDPREGRYGWLEEVPALNRPFLLHDYEKAFGGLNMQKMVFVECGSVPTQHIVEAEWIGQMANGEPRLSGIVATAPMEEGRAVGASLETLAAMKRVKGIRRNIQDEAEQGFCLREGFITAVKMLSTLELSFDICIRHHQMEDAIELVRRCPNVQFMLDHMGKPDIRHRRLEPWKSHMQALACLPNVWCKISGLATEADPEHWRPHDLKPYIDHAIDCFGFERVAYGGDWPVALLATEYGRWVEALQWAVRECSSTEQRKLFHDNAVTFYRL